jgi:hypothetical protein
VSRPFRMLRSALVNGNAMVDAINYQVVCKNNERPNFILMSPRVTFSFIEHEVLTLKGQLLADGTVP